MVQLTQQRFGHLVAIRTTQSRKHGGVVWECQCDCGQIAYIAASRLTSGHTKSCGCLACSNKDLQKQRFGKLTVRTQTDRPMNSNRRGLYWLCDCDCGNHHIVLGADLRNSTVQSCGCLHREVHKQRRLPPGRSSLNRHLRTYKYCAQKRGLEWELGRLEFEAIVKRVCFYCDAEPSNAIRESSGTFYYNGIDRYNNELGYVAGNCVPCCKVCNLAKNNQSIEQFKDWLVRTATRLVEKKF